jgi:hypothetical protein
LISVQDFAFRGRPVSLLVALYRAVKQTGPSLVDIAPFSNYMDGVDLHRDDRQYPVLLYRHQPDQGRKQRGVLVSGGSADRCFTCCLGEGLAKRLAVPARLRLGLYRNRNEKLRRTSDVRLYSIHPRPFRPARHPFLPQAFLSNLT